jgi:DMSO/TMAO reductase YedYZ molybdopterin-dependent catalytic subunit
MSRSVDELPPPEPAPAGGPPPVNGQLEDRHVTRELRRISRRGFAVAGAAALAGVGGWRWVANQMNHDGIPWPLRNVLMFNEQLARGAFRSTRLSPEFPRSMARIPRANGSLGISSPLDLARWRLRVIGQNGGFQPRIFTLDEIKALPRVEMTTELRCIEGWSEVVYWAGARLADLTMASGLAMRGGPSAGPTKSAGSLLKYVGLETPDRYYYVGLDMASALHPQTLLAYEMAGLPLTLEHGAPLRLVTPVKYGIKSIKRIGTIRFTDDRPADFWAERGYDWYAGH